MKGFRRLVELMRGRRDLFDRERECVNLYGSGDASIKLINTVNGMIVEYMFFPTLPQGGSVLLGGPIGPENIIRRIVTPEEYTKLGDIILEMHVTAAARKARP